MNYSESWCICGCIAGSLWVCSYPPPSTQGIFVLGVERTCIRHSSSHTGDYSGFKFRGVNSNHISLKGHFQLNLSAHCFPHIAPTNGDRILDSDYTIPDIDLNYTYLFLMNFIIMPCIVRIQYTALNKCLFPEFNHTSLKLAGIKF